jgi:hypothetical protein
MAGKGAVPLMVATLLLVRRDDIPRFTKLLFRIAALAALGQVVVALSWIAYEWRNIYNSGPAWTQITMAFAAALLALVALQPQEHNNSADGQESVAVDGAAGEFDGATDAAEE